MRKASVWICGAAALLLVGIGPAPYAQILAVMRKPPARRSPFTGDYASMIRTCNLTAEQQARVGEKIEAQKKALGDFDKENRRKRSALRENLADARFEKNAQAIKAAEKALKAFEQERLKVEAAAETQILALLKPDQRISWEGEVLYLKAGSALKASGQARLQHAKLYKICAKYAKQVVSSRDLARAWTDAVQQIVKEYGRDDTKSKPAPPTGKDAVRP